MPRRFCLCLMLLGCLNVERLNSQILDTLLWEGVPRTYSVYLPNDYTPAQYHPLVLSLHPGLSNAVNHANASKWHELGKTEGFITVYPNGSLSNPNGTGRLWNAYNQPSSVALVDDVGFLNALLDALISKYAVDTCRVYLSGFSNGAMMLFRMACEATHRFAAYAPLSGGWGYGADGFCGDGNCNGDPASDNCDWEMAFVNCQPSRRPSLIFMKGSLEGDNLPTCRATTDSLGNVFWANFLNCAAGQQDTVIAAGKTVVRWQFNDCLEGASYQFLTVLGNGHVWHQPATAMFWDFLKTKSSCAPASGTHDLSAPLPIKIFPNPSDGRLNISAIPSDDLPFALYNSLGQEIKRGVLPPAGIIDLQELMDGVYWLRIGDKVPCSFFKFIKN